MKKILFYPLTIVILLVSSISLVAFRLAYDEDPFLKKITQQIQQYWMHMAPEKVYLQLDRTWYQAGETVWFNAFLRDAEKLQASSKSEILYVELINPKSKVEHRLSLFGKDGAVCGDFQLSQNAVGGTYKLKAYTQWQKNTNSFFEKEFQVQNTVLPNLKMKLDFEQKAFGPGSEVVAKLDLESLENEALVQHDCKFYVQLGGKQILKSSTKTDEEGRAYLSFHLPKDLQTNDGLLNVVISYNDQEESIARAIPIVLNDIDLQFLPEGGAAVADLKTKYAFKAINEFGKPADVAGVVYNQNDEVIQEFKSFHQGMGAVDFTPKAGEHYYAKITAPVALDKKYHLPNTLLEGFAMQVRKIKKTGIAVDLNSHQFRGKVFLVAQSRGKVVFRQQYNLFGKKKKLFIPTEDIPMGILQLTLFDEQQRVRCERLVFLNQHQQLKVDIQSDKEKYLPREKVKMKVSVKDDQGKAVTGKFALAVADDKLLSFADDRQGHILASMLLEADLETKVEEPNFYFDPEEEKATQALDYLMLTQGWRNYNWQAIQQAQLPQLAYQGERLQLAGKVLNAQGLAIPNAKIELLDPHIILHSKTDGSFEMPMKEFDYVSTLVVSAPNYESQYIKVQDYCQALDIRLTKAAWTIQKEASDTSRIEGYVFDASSGESLPFASILLSEKGKAITGVSTDFEGKFSIPFTNQENEFLKLKVNYVGFLPMEIPMGYLKKGNKYSVQVQLPSSVINLDQLQITSYKVPQQITTTSSSISIVTDDQVDLRIAERAELPPAPAVIEEVPEALLEDDFEMEIEEEPEAMIIAEAKDKENKNVDLAKRRQAMPVVPPPPPPPAADVAELKKEEIFRVVEKMPMFYSVACESLTNQADRQRCAQENMLRSIYQHLRYPKAAMENCVEGMVVINFVIDKYGKAKNFKVVRDIGAGCGQAALQSVAQISEFIPGMQRGKPVDVQYNIPVKFSSDGTCIGGSADNKFHLFNRTKVSKRFYQAKTFYVPKYQAKELVERRTDFRPTIYWNPALDLDKNGEASVEFYTSDDMTAFKATVEGISSSGKIGRQEHKIYTQKPFYLSAKLPTQVLTGDQIRIPLSLVNNTNSKLKGALNVDFPNSLKAMKKWDKRIRLKAKEKKTIYLSFLVEKETKAADLQIKFDANGLSDELLTTIQSKSRGFPVEETRVGGAQLVQNFDLDIRNPIEGSLKASLKFYPSALSEVVEGMEKMLRHPGGCFEQTSSSNYPNLLVLDYLRSYELNNPAIEQKAKKFLKVGYKRLTGFESASGGFEWYGRDPGHEALTAYGIMQFVDMSKVFDVDQKMIKRTSKWLLNRRDGNGGWLSSKSHGWYVNNEIGGAYVVWALCEAGMGHLIKKELDKSYQDALKSEDPYLMALIANALLKENDQRAAALLKDLKTRQKENGSWHGLKHSATRSRGVALKIETTAMATLAFLKAEENAEGVDRAIRFISQSKNQYGFGNTQSTIMALKALVSYTKLQRRTKAGGEIVVQLDGKKLERIAYKANQTEKIHIDNLERFLKDGKQELTVKFKDTKQALNYELVLNYTTNLPSSDAECSLGMETQLSRQKTNMGETLRLTAKIENRLKEAVASPIAMLGIPAGLSLQTWQLKAMQEEQQFAYYEIFDGYVVLYFDGFKALETKQIHLDLKADIPGKYEAPASRVYPYYQNEFQTWSMPDAVVIGE